MVHSSNRVSSILELKVMMKNGFKLILPIRRSRIFHRFISKLFFFLSVVYFVYEFFFLNKIREIFDPFHICLPQLSVRI